MLIGQLQNIYELTLLMSTVLTEDRFDELDELLNKRQILMDQVDEYKERTPEYRYTKEENELLKKIIEVDLTIEPLLKKYMDEIRKNLNQIKTAKVATNKYQPYVKQINGAFVDTKE